MIRLIDVQGLREKVRTAAPFPHFVIDGFLEPDFARTVYDAFPAYEDAVRVGRTFKTVNERKKTQITDETLFAPPVRELNRLLSQPDWLNTLSQAFELPRLLPDEQLHGGGIHQTGSRGRLDVHVDFNYIADRQLHRRLNVIVFLNPDWQPEWGGRLELWDREVKHCHHSIEPLFNRCVVFETSDISFHGVTAVNCPPGRSRKSFAAYYYTKEPPAHWSGEAHDTIFRSRPNEVLKGQVLMPAERMVRSVRQRLEDLKWRIKAAL